MKLALAALLLFSSATPALAGRDYQPGWSKQEKCFKRVYREEYVPGTFKNPGYVRTYKKRVRVPCESQREVQYMPALPRYYQDAHPHTGHVDNNSCIEGSILGGIAGGGIGAAASRKEGRLWAIPLGIVGGAMVGCQIDGG